METSAAVPTPSTTPGAGARQRAYLTGAFEGAALALPTTLGGVLLVYAQIGDAYMGAGMLAALLGMVLMHLATLPSARPMLYSARLFEATTLAAMLSQLPVQLRTWGIEDSPEVRLAFLCLVVTLSSGVGVVLYLVRADRLIRFIPTPVFQGFSNSIALLLLLSQFRTLWRLAAEGHNTRAMLVVMAVSVGVMLLMRLRLPRLPAAAFGLAAGALAGQAVQAAGSSTPMLASVGQTLQLPVMQAQFGFLVESSGSTLEVAAVLLSHSTILGVMAFINHTVSAETLTQADGRRADSLLQRMLPSLAGMATGALGALPIIASLQASVGAMRLRPIHPFTVLWCALVFLLVALVGLPWWMPVTAVCGVMFADAWYLFDRVSVKQFGRWLRRRPLSANARADLALVAVVTLTAVIYNMVAAALVGLLLGLLLFAARNARKPLRQVWTGGQMRSNCARSSAERDWLDREGGRIKVFELEGDLFFGAASTLEQAVRPHLPGLSVALFDWTAVRHVDTSVAQTVARLERELAQAGQSVMHAGVLPGGPVEAVLNEQWLMHARFPDLDRALEAAENQLVATPQAQAAGGAGADERASLLRGLDDRDAAILRNLMVRQRYADGETVFEAGSTSRDLVLVLSGSANVVVHTAAGQELRLAAVRPGAMLGEVGFLDGAPRSATIRARGALEVASLSRADFDRLGLARPDLAQRLLSNIAVDLATRLRSTNALLTARNRGG